jgi:hypothetical protein
MELPEQWQEQLDKTLATAGLLCSFDDNDHDDDDGGILDDGQWRSLRMVGVDNSK